jgi:hypothetical protein
MATNWITAYHGTTSDALSSILKDGLRPTRGAGHWLGDNCIYFSPGDPDFSFKFAVRRAKIIAERKGIKCNPVLLAAEIDLTDCFNLCHLYFREEAATAGQSFIETVPPEVWPEVKQNKEIRSFDSMVLRHIMKTARTPQGKPYSSLMAIVSQRGFTIDPEMIPEARPLYRVKSALGADGKPLESWLNLHDHLELAVFNQSRIHNVRVTELATHL